MTDSTLIVLSLGTSNKSFTHFLQELRNYKIATVIDVRETPQSRFFPHFSKKKLEEGLARQEIAYQWRGASLGNPKPAAGKRSLEGFRDYQLTAEYRGGLAELWEFLQGASGNAAIICAEADETVCHRQFILKDLKELAATSANPRRFVFC